MTNLLQPTTHLRAAAWMPDDDAERPWEEAIVPAAQWIWGRSREKGAPPVLVSNSANSSLPAVTCADGTYVIGTPSRAATFRCSSFAISENATATSNAEALVAGQPMSQHAECKFTGYERRCSSDLFETIAFVNS